MIVTEVIENNSLNFYDINTFFLKEGCDFYKIGE